MIKHFGISKSTIVFKNKIVTYVPKVEKLFVITKFYEKVVLKLLRRYVKRTLDNLKR